jgi:hypothetical protein
MSNRKLEEFDEYRYGPRGVLCRGDLFRVSGGPFYENSDGSKSLMAERGTFKFVRYCVKGAEKWIEAQRAGGGNVVLWVGKAGPNPLLALPPQAVQGQEGDRAQGQTGEEAGCRAEG